MKAPPPGLSFMDKVSMGPGDLMCCEFNAIRTCMTMASHAGSLPPLKPAAARRRKMDQQCGNLRALWGGLIGVLVLAAGFD